MEIEAPVAGAEEIVGDFEVVHVVDFEVDQVCCFLISLVLSLSGLH